MLGGSIPDTAATQRGALHRHFMQVGLETLELDQEDLRIFLSVAKSWNPKSPDDLTDMFEVQSLTLAANIAQRLLENDELLGDRLWDDLMALSIDLDHLCDDAISAPVLPLWSRPTPSTGAKRGRSRLFDFYTDRQGFEVSVPGFAGDEFERFMEVLQYWHPKFWLDTVLACGGKDVGAALYVAEGVLMHGELLGHPYRRKLKRFYNTFDKWSRQE